MTGRERERGKERHKGKREKDVSSQGRSVCQVQHLILIFPIEGRERGDLKEMGKPKKPVSQAANPLKEKSGRNQPISLSLELAKSCQ